MQNCTVGGSNPPATSIFPLEGPMSQKAFFIFVFGWLIRILQRTHRFKALNEDPGDTRHCIYAVWHQNILPSVYTFMHSSPHACLVSNSKLGRIFSSILGKLGHPTVEGVADRGGTEALLQMIKIIKNRRIPGFCAVDGSQDRPKSPNTASLKWPKKPGSPSSPCPFTPNAIGL